MEFEEFLVYNNSKNTENNDIEDNIAENATNPTSNVEHYEGEIRPYMFEPMCMNDRNDSDNNDQVVHNEAQGRQRNSIQATA